MQIHLFEAYLVVEIVVGFKPWKKVRISNADFPNKHTLNKNLAQHKFICINLTRLNLLKISETNARSMVVCIPGVCNV